MPGQKLTCFARIAISGVLHAIECVCACVFVAATLGSCRYCCEFRLCVVVNEITVVAAAATFSIFSLKLNYSKIKLEFVCRSFVVHFLLLLLRRPLVRQHQAGRRRGEHKNGHIECRVFCANVFKNILQKHKV